MQEPAEMTGQKAGGRRIRPVGENICATKGERNRLREAVQEFVGEVRPVGPLSMDELRGLAGEVILRSGVGEKYKNFISVLVSNEVWRERVASIPYRKRLLLMPQCLRSVKDCQAEMDEFGLICARCGSCVIDMLQGEAERLGYVVMVAEGSPMVMALIESGQVEAVIGVSCLSVLEEVFPYMEAGAVPGMAIPLLQDGCADTSVDVEWVLEALELSSGTERLNLDLQELRTEVNGWFGQAGLARLLGESQNETEKIARGWLGKSGKRWRPFLTAGVWRCLAADSSGEIPESLSKLAVAVECFHKASLVHDDIEDDDAERYGEQTVHEEYGVAMALNVGDFLLGEGYRLIGELEIGAEAKGKILQVAAAGHRTLSLGQGAELWWQGHKKALSVGEVLEIFRQKTAPAFEVALRLGAIYAGADGKVEEVLRRYSEALGIAYQIREDLEDIEGDQKGEENWLKSMQPSILPAIGYEESEGEDKKLLEGLWLSEEDFGKVGVKPGELYERLKVEAGAREMLEIYKNQATQALSGLDNTDLKSMLRRVIYKIFNSDEVMSCCDDYQARHAGGGEEGGESVG